MSFHSASGSASLTLDGTFGGRGLNATAAIVELFAGSERIFRTLRPQFSSGHAR
jgi:hypothetical protein